MKPRARKSEGAAEPDHIHDGLMDLAFEDSEEEKKSEGIDELQVKMKALSVNGGG